MKRNYKFCSEKCSSFVCMNNRFGKRTNPPSTILSVCNNTVVSVNPAVYMQTLSKARKADLVVYCRLDDDPNSNLLLYSTDEWDNSEVTNTCHYHIEYIVLTGEELS